MSKLEKIYLHTGSNRGNREDHLLEARKQISQFIGPITAASSLYETEAWGFTDQPNFVNQALEVITDIIPEQLLDLILKIELEMGRVRNQKWTPRLIDIDIIFYGNKIIETEKLTIPHPFMHERNFVLIPLAEIAKGFIHPKLGMSVEMLFENSKDTLEVKTYELQ